jgi:hypothetical protein
MDDGGLFAVARAVAEIVEHVRDDVRVGRGGIERERELPVGSRSPDPSGHDDKVARCIEARDLHANSSGRRGAQIGPVKKWPMDGKRSWSGRA